MATKSWLEFEILHNFMVPNEPLKQWYVDSNQDDESFRSIWETDWGSLMEVVGVCRDVNRMLDTVDKKLMSNSKIDEQSRLVEELKDHLYGADIKSVHDTCVRIVKLYHTVTGLNYRPGYIEVLASG